MNIALCGSINFSNKMLEIAKVLEKGGHSVNLPYYTNKIKNGEITQEDFIKQKEIEGGDARFRKEASEDLIKRYYRLINNSDAILVVNINKKRVENYIGGNTLMEMGFAYVLDKKIYLLNDIPVMSYTDEIMDMKPIILNGDLSKIGAEK